MNNKKNSGSNGPQLNHAQIKRNAIANCKKELEQLCFIRMAKEEFAGTRADELRAAYNIQLRVQGCMIVLCNNSLI